MMNSDFYLENVVTGFIHTPPPRPRDQIGSSLETEVGGGRKILQSIQCFIVQLNQTAKEILYLY